MTPEQLEKRQQRAREGDWIISESEDGYQVHAPGSSGTPYLVSGLPNDPTCTCPDYEHHASDPDWRCKHILAVLDRVGGSAKPTPRKANGEAAGSRVLIKRSVSPDGKIDALSVEVSAPVDGQTAPEAETRAGRMLALSDRIVDRFLQKNGDQLEENGGEPAAPRRPEPRAKATVPPGRSEPAELVTVRGEDGKWGRRLYITVRTEDGYLRLYGTENQLAEHLIDAGYPELSDRIEEDASLRAPCRIVTETNEDGYVEVTDVLPPAREAETAGPRGQSR